MIIARLESLIAGFPAEDALLRADAYVKAGADGVMIHSKTTSGEDVRAFCTRFREKHRHIPMVLVPTTYHEWTKKELAGWSANVVIYANHLLRASYPTLVSAAKSSLAPGRSLEADSVFRPIKQILELIPGGK
jgi:phosphoenolpyruvate phosphomutase